MEEHVDLSSIVSSYSFSDARIDSPSKASNVSFEVNQIYLELKKEGAIKDKLFDLGRMKD